jgi:beta-glucosidase
VNTGARAGTDVVQLYARDDVASVARPDQLLVGFARVALAPGEASTVTFVVDPSRLAFYDPDMRFVVEPGAFTFWVGPGGQDAAVTPPTTINLTGNTVELHQRDVVATTVRAS